MPSKKVIIITTILLFLLCLTSVIICNFIVRNINNEEEEIVAKAIPLSEVKYWAYQIQGLNEDDAVGKLANSNYDILVIEPTRTDWSGSDKDFDTKEMVKRLKNTKTSDGVHQKLVIAYINIAEAEDWRWYWTWLKELDSGGALPGDWPDYILTIDPDGWVGNYPVAYWRREWKDIIINGTDISVDSEMDYSSVLEEVLNDGFDGVYLDWVEAFEDEHVIDAARRDGVDPEVEMVTFIREIKEYGLARNPDFLVIQQNGSALTKEHPELYSIVDAIAQEAIWYDGEAYDDWEASDGYDTVVDELLTDEYIENLTKYKKAGLPVFDCEYALEYSSLAYERSLGYGFIPYVTRRSLSKLTTTPPEIE
ncbi:endo alpha-1,4 polygalactosaminidase [Patescibacteria group bacterium]